MSKTRAGGIRRWVLAPIVISLVLALQNMKNLMNLVDPDARHLLDTGNVSFKWRPEPSGSRQIRRWGCDRTETPFIFVHIGKSGGGNIRPRIAASSLNYTKGNKFWKPWDGSYYPVHDVGDQEQKAYFCNSGFSNFRPNPNTKTFEGTQPCLATTPIGQAIACPAFILPTERCPIGCERDSETCRLVYVGHNYLGSEMHWLPSRYLSKWWTEQWQASDSHEDQITERWKTFTSPGNLSWCHPFANEEPPRTKQQYDRLYETCSIPLANSVDNTAVKHVSRVLMPSPRGHHHEHISNITSWGPLYASLPVLRATVLREPFSWLVSKFFWHGGGDVNHTCDDVDMAMKPYETDDISDLGYHWARLYSREEWERAEPGWVERFSMKYILFLCGEDCAVRLSEGNTDLPSLERQAEDNLRQSFAVVGLLNETDTFYEMISLRVQYMNTSLNMHVDGADHTANMFDEYNQCRDLFKDPELQGRFMAASPTLRALVRLYSVGVEVNRLQLDELRECSARTKAYD